jgi:3-deoxy-manno-octulosonate cytidylyltransferase (CMP-KDO synthetase)
VIPARLASTRLPRKPLIPIAGRPLIEWVWQRMSRSPALDALVVAADASEIVQAVQGFGGQAVLTREDHASGTDRVAEVASRDEFTGFDCIVNLQGDEPFLPEEAVEAAIRLVEDGWDVGTVAVPVASPEDWADPSVVKVVRGDDGRALYFSRAAIPHGAGESASGLHRLRHVGLYAFSRAALRQATGLPEHPLERVERLEQLRWLAAGLRIGVAVVDGGGPGIDTEADLVRAEAILGGRVDST